MSEWTIGSGQLRAARAFLNLTQIEVSRLTGVSLRHLKRLEAPTRRNHAVGDVVPGRPNSDGSAAYLLIDFYRGRGAPGLHLREAR